MYNRLDKGLKLQTNLAAQKCSEVTWWRFSCSNKHPNHL